MDDKIIPVEDKVITTSQTITKIGIEIVNLVLGSSARFCVKKYSGGAIVDIAFVDILGPDYTAWGSDDKYIENFILSALGFVKKE